MMSQHNHSDYTICWFRLTGTELIVYTVISFLAVLISYDRWKRRRFVLLADKLNGPKDYPIIGSALDFIGTPKQIYEHFTKLRDKYNHDLFKVWLGSSLYVVIRKPEDIQIILNSSNALKKGFIYKFLGKVLGKGLIIAPVSRWKIHRRLISPLFKSVNLKEHYFPVFMEKSKILIQNLHKEVGKTQPFDISEYVSNITLSTVCQTTMDYNLDIQSDIGSEFMINGTKALELMSNRALTVWLYPDIIYFMYCKIFGLENAYKLTKKLPRLMTEKKKNEYAHNAIDKNTIETSENDDKKKRSKALVDLLLETNKVGGNLSNEDIIDEVLTIIGAGYETTTSTVGFCILLLAIHSDIQERVYDEIHSVLGDGNETITIEHTTKLVYMKQVINETLRLFPIAPLMLRELQADVTIISGNHTLPKGTACVISPMVTHFIPELYSNPELFNPDNFNADNVAKRHKYSFIPFSGGPRSCIGMKYALLNITVLLTQILRNFSVHTDLKFSDIKLKFNLTIKSVNGYPVTIRPRNSALVTS